MQYAFVGAVLVATVAAATVGDGVPLIYAATPYPNPPYKGVQYNATVINGVQFNSSNEWPCLSAEKYYTVPPPCAERCLRETFKNDTVCAADDFTCHCTAAGSAELDKFVIPCLSASTGECTGEEIGQLANFVHAALCPYFATKTYEEAYGNCGRSPYGSGSYTSESPKPSSSSKVGEYWPKTSSTSAKGGDYWPKTSSSNAGESWPKTSSTSPKGGDYWPKTSSSSTLSSSSKAPCTTSLQTSWTKECSGPTTFSYGTKTWTVTKATTVTVTDCPITWTKPISSGTWAPVEWTSPVAPVIVSTTWAHSASTSAATPDAGWAEGTAAYSAPPVKFTGVAANNRVAGAAVAVAAGAALLI